MAQFDVYLNYDKETREEHPYLVDIQHTVIDDLITRMVLPLTKQSNLSGGTLSHLTPVIEYGEEQLVLLTPQIKSVPTDSLKEPVGSLAYFRDEILDALDFSVSGV